MVLALSTFYFLQPRSSKFAVNVSNGSIDMPLTNQGRKSGQTEGTKGHTRNTLTTSLNLYDEQIAVEQSFKLLFLYQSIRQFVRNLTFKTFKTSFCIEKLFSNISSTLKDNIKNHFQSNYLRKINYLFSDLNCLAFFFQ